MGECKILHFLITVDRVHTVFKECNFFIKKKKLLLIEIFWDNAF